MKIVRITLLGCLAAVWIVACGQDTAEPPSPDPVDSWYNEDDIDNYHHWPFVVAVWKALGKNPFKATKAELATVTRLPQIHLLGFISQSGIDLLAACVNLVELEIVGAYLSNEQLAALSGLTKLESLNLYENRITDLSPIARLTNLRTLDISANRITDLRLRPVIELPNLTALSAGDIGLTDLSPLVGLVNLQILELARNDIADLSPLVGLVNLQVLDLARNDIADLSPLAGLVNLQYLDLWRNQIEDLSPLAGLVRLQDLDLSGNQIEDLSPLLDNVGIGAGDKIDLRANQLSDISRNQHVPALEARGVIVHW